MCWGESWRRGREEGAERWLTEHGICDKRDTNVQNHPFYLILFFNFQGLGRNNALSWEIVELLAYFFPLSCF